MKNKNIIITGTSRGIGYEMALQFANAGHKVLAISRKTPQILIEHENITCLPIDISDENQLQQVNEFVSKTWKKVDVLIHNAGSLLHKNFTKISTQGKRKSCSNNQFYGRNSRKYEICWTFSLQFK